MKDKKVLFITFDLSGYYDHISKGLSKHFSDVESHNIAYIEFKYKNIFQKIYSAFYKIIKKQKLKNFYKLQPIIESTQGKTYDYIIIVRPDLFFDVQLQQLKKRTKHFIAYYHDSINNIERKKDVIHFFDKVYAYEKKDVKDYNLDFLANFIYLDNYPSLTPIEYDGFTIMSKDYRLETLEKIASFFKANNISYKFLVHSDKEQPKSDSLTFITKRQNNQTVLEHISKCNFIIDIHKYGIQNGLTFRVFESLFFQKKLITSNHDIKTYDFYNPNNIYVLEPNKPVEIPLEFFNTPYQALPEAIYQKYHYTNWITTLINKNDI
ncbi:hypothetical protein A9Q86_02860 [Flavobacteriales bacterium 33_180_T64]|nr:hypothetical protein A9Q86_02860 [Flavobacteriales bacterium 33_180_T64]